MTIRNEIENIEAELKYEYQWSDEKITKSRKLIIKKLFEWAEHFFGRFYINQLDPPPEVIETIAEEIVREDRNS